MRALAAGLLTALAISATAATANDGDYASAEPVAIDKAIAGDTAQGREGFWLIALGGADLVDGYLLDPPPSAGDRVAIVGATEDGSRIPVTLELVRRFGGQVVARASLLESEAFADWVADAPVYLRVSIEEGADLTEMLIGVRIGPAEQVAAPKRPDVSETQAPAMQDKKSAPVRALVVPAD
jgi:hypothetical protein